MGRGAGGGAHAPKPSIFRQNSVLEETSHDGGDSRGGVAPVEQLDGSVLPG